MCVSSITVKNIYGMFGKLKADLKQRTEDSGLKFRLAREETLFYTVDKNKCVVLQMVPMRGMPFFIRAPTCFIRLRPEINWGETGRQIALSVSGAMKFVQYSDSDTIKFGGSLHQFHFKTHNVNINYCDNRQCVPYLFVSPLSCNNETRSDIFFSLSTNLQLPIFDYVFHIEIIQLFYSKSWVDIKLSNLPCDRSLSLNLDGPQALSEAFWFRKKITQVFCFQFIPTL